MTLDNNSVKKTNSYTTPWFTGYISITIIAQFLLINYKESFQTINPETFTLFGAPDAVEIYKGQFWGVFTNNFIHIYWTQLLINLAGIWFFGAFIERRIGFLKLITLLVIASIVPSLWQLSLTTEPGIGLSGVNYTLFGYILTTSLHDDRFKLKGWYYFLIFMIGVLLYCWYVNEFIEDKFRTEAMTIGFFLGLLLGKLNTLNQKMKFSVLSIVLILSFGTLVFAPWSSEWQLYKGIKAHESRNYKQAGYFYRKTLKIAPDNFQAQKNLNLLIIDKIKAKAYRAHIAKNYELARRYYLQILELEPEDEWAKENLKELP